MYLLRTKETHHKYLAYRNNGGLEKGCALCERESLKEFRFWRVIKNEFPYDRVAETHDMLIPKRHTGEGGLTEEERKELWEIKCGEYINNNYHFIMEAVTKIKSIPNHFHLHLTKIKDPESTEL
ncbi:MAG: hypothetical protein COU11_03595 [Candidatus Harrisonbacteria bacterium CG10_big_fil_rev_8_21_14_0_10_49_15]|uniref:HIT domain-containing protein n=1 Tax=Candidatus Harrisonbacteria bacterium CG10_big_fil_rev_8_21_14_0_10_49_15 TaxID=1974587 RepID=A0A2H0UKI8_9BACT|nr:MAG: hypothetical protein COU11_03595 [Candidatus Harrisonbacteria bacterium CG10_big_fil_rev_8_21_14_0_10_49_15]